MFAEKISMVIVNMETYVSLNMWKKFAMIAIAMCLFVTKDIQEFADGLESLEDVNLHHFVNINMKNRNIWGTFKWN